MTLRFQHFDLGIFNMYPTDAPTILSDWKWISMKIIKIKGRDAN